MRHVGIDLHRRFLVVRVVDGRGRSRKPRRFECRDVEATGLPAVKIVRARDSQPGFAVSRRIFEGDPHLPVIDIEVEWAEAA